jgi:hypothetical protein
LILERQRGFRETWGIFREISRPEGVRKRWISCRRGEKRPFQYRDATGFQGKGEILRKKKKLKLKVINGIPWKLHCFFLGGGGSGITKTNVFQVNRISTG